MDERRRYRITGRVQGVGYRAWTIRRAGELGLRGQVRNERDGSVTVEAGGSVGALDAFENFLRQGPRFAAVDDLAVLPPGNEPLPERFDVAW